MLTTNQVAQHHWKKQTELSTHSKKVIGKKNVISFNFTLYKYAINKLKLSHKAVTNLTRFSANERNQLAKRQDMTDKELDTS